MDKKSIGFQEIISRDLFFSFNDLKKIHAEVHKRCIDDDYNNTVYIGYIEQGIQSLGLHYQSLGSLLEGDYFKTEMQEEILKNYIRDIHRLFYMAIHLRLERALIDICNNRNITVKTSLSKGYLRLTQNIRKNVDIVNFNKIEKYLNGIESKLNKMRPSFQDYFNAVWGYFNGSKEKGEQWNNFLSGLTVARNKSGHSVSLLSENDKDKLLKSGLKCLVSKNGTITFNFNYVVPIIERIVELFDCVYQLYRESTFNHDSKISTSNVIKLFPD